MLRTTPFPAMFFIYYISTQDNNNNNKRKERIRKVYNKKESKLKTRKKIEKKNNRRKSPGTNQGVYFILYKKSNPAFFSQLFSFSFTWYNNSNNNRCSSYTGHTFV
jgi:hypothetical protein